MIVQHLLLVLFILYLLPMCYCVSDPVPKSGPFKTSIVSVKTCKNPVKPYLKNSPVIFDTSVYNIDGNNMLHGNITIFKDTKDVKMRIKIFEWRNGQWNPAQMFSNLNCHGLVIQLTFSTMKIKYDKKSCTFFKGVYYFQKLDLNQLQHIWFPTMIYGRLLWRAETYSNNGTFVCKEFDTNTEPAFYS